MKEMFCFIFFLFCSLDSSAHQGEEEDFGISGSQASSLSTHSKATYDCANAAFIFAEEGEIEDHLSSFENDVSYAVGKKHRNSLKISAFHLLSPLHLNRIEANPKKDFQEAATQLLMAYVRRPEDPEIRDLIAKVDEAAQKEDFISPLALIRKDKKNVLEWVKRGGVPAPRIQRAIDYFAANLMEHLEEWKKFKKSAEKRKLTLFIRSLDHITDYFIDSKIPLFDVFRKIETKIFSNRQKKGVLSFLEGLEAFTKDSLGESISYQQASEECRYRISLLYLLQRLDSESVEELKGTVMAEYEKRFQFASGPNKGKIKPFGTVQARILDDYAESSLGLQTSTWIDGAHGDAFKKGNTAHKYPYFSDRSLRTFWGINTPVVTTEFQAFPAGPVYTSIREKHDKKRKAAAKVKMNSEQSFFFAPFYKSVVHLFRSYPKFAIELSHDENWKKAEAIVKKTHKGKWPKFSRSLTGFPLQIERAKEKGIKKVYDKAIADYVQTERAKADPLYRLFLLSVYNESMQEGEEGSSPQKKRKSSKEAAVSRKRIKTLPTPLVP